MALRTRSSSSRLPCKTTRSLRVVAVVACSAGGTAGASAAVWRGVGVCDCCWLLVMLVEASASEAEHEGDAGGVSPVTRLSPPADACTSSAAGGRSRVLVDAIVVGCDRVEWMAGLGKATIWRMDAWQCYDVIPGSTASTICQSHRINELIIIATTTHTYIPPHKHPTNKQSPRLIICF